MLGLEEVYDVDWTKMLGQQVGQQWVEKVQSERQKMTTEEKVAKFQSLL